MATAAEELDVDGVAVRLTNPDKVYFPKLGRGGTKGKVVDYYLVRRGPDGGLLRDETGPPSAAVPRRHRR